MSMPQRAEASRRILEGPGLDRDTAQLLTDLVNFPNVSLLRRVEAQVKPAADPAATSLRPGAPASRPASDQQAEAARKHAAAINLITEVSNTIPLLIQENDELRATLEEVRKRADDELQNATLIACEWRKAAEATKQQADQLERKLAEALERAERAEAELASEKQVSHRKSQEAAEAECLSSLFEDKVMSSFGTGSAFQSALERIRARSEQDWG